MWAAANGCIFSVNFNLPEVLSVYLLWVHFLRPLWKYCIHSSPGCDRFMIIEISWACGFLVPSLGHWAFISLRGNWSGERNVSHMLRWPREQKLQQWVALGSCSHVSGISFWAAEWPRSKGGLWGAAIAHPAIRLPWDPPWFNGPGQEGKRGSVFGPGLGCFWNLNFLFDGRVLKDKISGFAGGGG